MSSRKIALLFLIVLAVIAYAIVRAVFQPGEDEVLSLPNVASIEGRDIVERPSVSGAIQFFEGRIKDYPTNALNYIILAQLQLRSARETGDVASYQRAETALYKASELLPDSSPVEASLASALYAQHNFADALELAQQVYKRDARSTLALATIGDTHLEFGDYQKAEQAYQELLNRSSAAPAATYTLLQGLLF